MIEIIPNWHPVFVHFTVGLLAASTLVFLAALLLKPSALKTEAETAALWMLWLGAGFTILTVAAGLYAYATVGHDDPSHAAMKEHRNLALPTAAAFLALAVYSLMRVRRKKILPAFFPWLMLAAAVLLGVTAWHGAELVYRHGLGVMALPQAEGEGHGHDTADESMATDMRTPMEAEGDGHGHDVADKGMAMDMETPMETQGEGHDHDAADEGMAMDMGTPMEVAADRSTPEGTVEAFHAALKHGDAAAAKESLDPDVLIYESGYAERSAAEYAGHHLPADMDFAGTMDHAVITRAIQRMGDLAVVTSEGQTRGMYKDKAYDLLSTETVILKRAGGGWVITHIHWSSHPDDRE